ncbi:MAG: hypothetical protein MJZ46_04915, partial [Bacteroidales bacterium]|nr:hypothetical protein [Bacteroidales bacterium]
MKYTKSTICFIVFAVSAVFSACVKHELTDTLQGKMTVIEAFSPNEASKTILGNGGVILWDGTESIKVFHDTDGYGDRFTSVDSSKRSKATFNGYIGEEAKMLYAIYPYTGYSNSGNIYDSSTGKYFLNVPGVQTATAGSFDKNAFPSVASAAFGNPLHFQGVCGGFCFTVASDKVTKVVFRGNNGEILAGGVYVSTSSGVPTVVEYGKDVNTDITLLPSSETFEPNTKYYISMLPSDFTKGFTVDFFTQDGDVYHYIENTHRTLKSLVFGRVEDVDENLSIIVGRRLLSDTCSEYAVKLLKGDASAIKWTWSVSDDTVAAVVNVSENRCTVRNIKNGIAVLTAKSGNGKIVVEINISVFKGNDLSFNGTANCYIVSKAGYYGFKAVKGNSLESIGSVSKAEVLWESFGTTTEPNVGDIIKSASYADGYIVFSTPSTLKNGNAVIAAKDASDNILWSWHIWVCNGYDPAATNQVYNNNAGTMMDRNLGATSDVKGSGGDIGLLYQWGRKDPFLGTASINGYTSQVSTGTWPSEVSSNSSIGTVAYSVSHPTTFITSNGSNGDWYYTGSSSTDNTRWTTSKTIYDPCPPGYRVPDGGNSGVWSKAFGTSSYWNIPYNWDSSNKGIKGMDFGKTEKKLGSGTIWYPTSNQYSDDFDSVFEGCYWSCTPDGKKAYNFYFYYDIKYQLGVMGTLEDEWCYPSYSRTRAAKWSVRCLSESRHDSGQLPAGSVDLGLSVFWAACNLGASVPEEYGGYYQWAGTKDVTDESIYLDYSNCPYHTGSIKEQGWTKYVSLNCSSYWSGSGSPDNKTILDLYDDVAHGKLGSNWRMPTDEEWTELLNNCTSECTTLNGVCGRMFTSRKNGNSIFLPAAG